LRQRLLVVLLDDVGLGAISGLGVLMLLNVARMSVSEIRERLPKLKSRMSLRSSGLRFVKY